MRLSFLTYSLPFCHAIKLFIVIMIIENVEAASKSIYKNIYSY